MSVVICCASCKHRMAIPEKFFGKTIRCSKCKEPIGVRPPLPQVSNHVKRPVRNQSNRRKVDRERLAGFKLQHRAWKKVQLGLLFHILSTFLIILGVVGGTLGWAIFCGGLIFGMLSGVSEFVVGMAIVTTVFLVSSVVLFVVAGICDFPNSVLCLFVPDHKARWLTAAYLINRAIAFLLPLIIFVVPSDQMMYVVLALILVFIAAWVIWLLFLRRIAGCLHSEAHVLEARDLTVSFFMNAIGVPISIFFLSFCVATVTLAILALTQYAFGLATLGFFGIVGTAAIIKVSVLIQDGSIIDGLLALVGLKWIIRYFNFVSDLRAEIGQLGWAKEH